MKLRASFLLTALLAAVAVGSNASATVIHGDYFGTSTNFLGVQETSTFGDPEPLFGAPTVIGNQLLFFPSTFSASSAGGGVDQTGAQLQATIEATGGTVLTTINIQEFGDAVLTGIGTAATGTFASMSGFFTVLETLSGPIAPVIIPWVGTFSPTNLLSLPGDAGTTLWSGSVSIDVAASVADATKGFLSFNNDLIASSETGTSSLIEKKVVSGPAVVVTVPEPSLLAFAGLALVALVSRRNA